MNTYINDVSLYVSKLNIKLNKVKTVFFAYFY